jgi:transcription antitermination factor NusG
MAAAYKLAYTSTASIEVSMPQGWVAVQVQSGREDHSARGLSQRGYDVFSPSYVEKRRWSDRVKAVRRALFPGYIFCSAQTDGCGHIVSTPGVIRIVGAVEHNEIAAVQRAVECGLETEPSRVFGEGCRVLLEAGPLRGLTGEILRIKNTYRLLLSITVLQRQVSVEVDVAWLAVASAHSTHLTN